MGLFGFVAVFLEDDEDESELEAQNSKQENDKLEIRPPLTQTGQ